MKIDEQLNEVLNNFAQINPSIVFKPGTEVSTLKVTKSVMGKAKVKNGFDNTFAVYSLSQFLQVLSQFKNPEITVLDTKMQIQEGDVQVDYTFCDPKLIMTPPEKDIILPSVDVEFDLPNDSFEQIRKFAAILDSPEIAVVGDGEGMYVSALNVKNSADNVFRRRIGSTSHVFRLVFLVENLTLLPRDYHVKISAKGISHFSATDVEYWVAIESSSTFED
jgi:hypothetical protein